MTRPGLRRAEHRGHTSSHQSERIPANQPFPVRIHTLHTMHIMPRLQYALFQEKWTEFLQLRGPAETIEGGKGHKDILSLGFILSLSSVISFTHSQLFCSND